MFANIDVEKNLSACDEYYDDEIQCQALPRPSLDVDDDLSIPPMDGEQFLRRVIDEAKKCDAVSVAKMENVPQHRYKLPHLPKKMECSSELLPKKDWQVSITADFSELRLDMERLRKMISDDASMKKLESSLPKEDEDEEWLQICVENKVPNVGRGFNCPSTRLCLAMSQVKIWHLLSYIGDWLSDGLLEIENSCTWVYCLLACLELPVEPDIYASMREISRTLINRRAQLRDPNSEELVHINLVVCIIGRYFSQGDLADPFI